MCIASQKLFYENLSPNLISDNKLSWKQVKPFFSDKSPSYHNITLLHNGKIISDPTKSAEIINNFFTDEVNNLDIDRESHINDVINSISPVDNAIKMFNHPSLLNIKATRLEGNNTFSFISISPMKKRYPRFNIPPRLLKNNKDICTDVLHFDVNCCIRNGIFPENLKNADITPTFKKGDRLLKSNYRPVSILPTISKIYEKILYKQIYTYFDCIFSKYLCGFRKGHITQYGLLFMLERLKKALDNELPIAKLKAYGFTDNALALALALTLVVEN